jgi:hypothetical protein
MKHSIFAAVGLVAALAIPAIADHQPGHAIPAPMNASVSLKPTTFNVKGNGKFTARIDLPAPFAASDIDVASVEITRVNANPVKGKVAANRNPAVVSDNDGDGRAERLKVKFNRNDLRKALPSGLTQGNFNMTVVGKVGNQGLSFTGDASVRTTASMWGALFESIFGTDDGFSGN